MLTLLLVVGALVLGAYVVVQLVGKDKVEAVEQKVVDEAKALEKKVADQLKKS